MNNNIHPTLKELIDLAEDRPVRVSAPLPSSVSLEDTEGIRTYVDGEIRRALEDFVDNLRIDGTDSERVYANGSGIE